MKAIFIFAALLLQVFSTDLFSQIPNNGFEIWNNMGGYLDPQDYKTANSYSAGTFYPVTRTADHFPVAAGNWAVRIESNVSLLPNYAACGIALQNHETIMGGPRPYFQVTGHPVNFTGYYKFFPQNNDTMSILLLLYHGGVIVADAWLSVSTPVQNWTSFVIPIAEYTAADSGTVMLASYNVKGPPAQYLPRGNSVLYVDNLNFDVLISSTNEPGYGSIENHVFYPNPARDRIYCDKHKPASLQSGGSVTIFNNSGEVVLNEILNDPGNSLDISHLLPGIYFLVLENDNTRTTHKLVKVE